MNGGATLFGAALRRVAAWLPALAAWPAAARLFALEYVDQRHQLLAQPESPPAWAWFAAALLLGAATAGGLAGLRRRGNAPERAPETGLLSAGLPLLPLAAFRFFPMTYWGVILTIFLLALTAGRYFSQLRAEESGGRVRHAAAILAVAVLLYAAWGAYLQCRARSILAMQWFNWGHYYEALLNTWRGRFFHLNISHGCFLGSRFCPSLMILLPTLSAGAAGLFCAGSLLVASGAWLVRLLAAERRATPGEALFFALWYLLLPGTVNLDLPLLEGFHEVYLLLPAALGALFAYERKRYPAAWALVIFCFGVRETAPFMFLGFGATLFLSGRRRHGAYLALASAAALLLIFGVLMPLARPAGTAYAHVSFYPHLGDTVPEIALSPLLRPKAFFGSVFSAHSLRYCAALFLPFAFLAFAAPKWLLPLVFDLAMVAADRRFDSQTLLRHYQCAMLITLVAASLEGFRLLREGRAPRWTRWYLCALPGARAVPGALAATLTATLGMTLFFTQVPGLPGADPRLEKWSDAREFVDGFAACMEPGAEVTAGPRVASLLAGKYDLYFDYDDPKAFRKYVLIESFGSFFGENRIRRGLLKSAEWTLLKSDYLDDRLVQLFVRRRRSAPPRAPTLRLTEDQWRNCGEPIPSGMPELELRGRVAEGTLFVAARIVAKLECDIGFSVRLGFHDAPDAEYFDSFGHGEYPADFASPGEVWGFSVPLPGKLKNCSVTLVKIP